MKCVFEQKNIYNCTKLANCEVIMLNLTLSTMVHWYISTLTKQELMQGLKSSKSFGITKYCFIFVPQKERAN